MPIRTATPRKRQHQSVGAYHGAIEIDSLSESAVSSTAAHVGSVAIMRVFFSHLVKRGAPEFSMRLAISDIIK